jgi:hypothetical protein
MIDTQSAPSKSAASDEAWLHSLRVTTANTAPPDRPSLPRRLAVGSLFGFIVVMTLVVSAEIARLPDGAFAGLLLRAHIKMAEVMPAASGLVVEVEQGPPLLSGGRGGSPHKPRQHRSSRTRQVASTEAIPDNSASPGHLQVLPIRPLHPFNVEVVSGGHRRLLSATSNAVQVDTSDSVSLLGFSGVQATASALQASRRGATLRALISAEGRVEDLWLVQGPPPSHAALSRVRQGRYRPFMLNGTPVEMEALIILDGDLPDAQRSSTSF